MTSNIDMEVDDMYDDDQNDQMITDEVADETSDTLGTASATDEDIASGDSTENIVDLTDDETEEQPVEDETEETVEQPAEEVPEEVAEQPVEDETEETVEQPAEEVPEEVAEQPVEAETEESVEQSAEEVPEEVEEQPAEDVLIGSGIATGDDYITAEVAQVTTAEVSDITVPEVEPATAEVGEITSAEVENATAEDSEIPTAEVENATVERSDVTFDELPEVTENDNVAEDGDVRSDVVGSTMDDSPATPADTADDTKPAPAAPKKRLSKGMIIGIVAAAIVLLLGIAAGVIAGIYSARNVAVREGADFAKELKKSARRYELKDTIIYDGDLVLNNAMGIDTNEYTLDVAGVLKQTSNDEALVEYGNRTIFGKFKNGGYIAAKGYDISMPNADIVFYSDVKTNGGNAVIVARSLTVNDDLYVDGDLNITVDSLVLTGKVDVKGNLVVNGKSIVVGSDALNVTGSATMTAETVSLEGKSFYAGAVTVNATQVEFKQGAVAAAEDADIVVNAETVNVKTNIPSGRLVLNGTDDKALVATITAGTADIAISKAEVTVSDNGTVGCGNVLFAGAGKLTLNSAKVGKIYSLSSIGEVYLDARSSCADVDKVAELRYSVDAKVGNVTNVAKVFRFRQLEKPTYLNLVERKIAGGVKYIVEFSKVMYADEYICMVDDKTDLAKRITAGADTLYFELDKSEYTAVGQHVVSIQAVSKNTDIYEDSPIATLSYSINRQLASPVPEIQVADGVYSLVIPYVEFAAEFEVRIVNSNGEKSIKLTVKEDETDSVADVTALLAAGVNAIYCRSVDRSNSLSAPSEEVMKSYVLTTVFDAPTLSIDATVANMTINFETSDNAGTFRLYANGAQVATVNSNSITFAANAFANGTSFSAVREDDGYCLESSQSEAVVYERVKATVAFDAKGGSECASIETYKLTTDMLAGVKPTKLRYDFLGWSVDGETVIEEDIELTDNITLYAIWQEKEAHTIRCMDGDQLVSTKRDSVLDKLPDDPNERDGYTFVGWSKTPGGTVLTEADLPIEIDSDIYLYAVWQADEEEAE